MKNCIPVYNNLVAIIFIGTGKYLDFFPKFKNTIQHYFLPKTHKEFFVFTDDIYNECLRDAANINVYKIEPEPWPFPTLKRFEYMNKAADQLKTFTHAIYIDADMYACRPIPEKEFFCHDKDYFAVEHPAFLFSTGTFETNPKSTAGINKEKDDLSIYHQACFMGGKSDKFLQMVDELEGRVNKDLKKDIIALWHDESHVNKFFSERREDVHVLDAGYAFVNYFPYMADIDRKFFHINKQSDHDD